MTDAIDEFLVRYTPEMQAISQRLRAIVMEAMPEGQEVLYADQNHIGYSFTGKANDRVLYICPMKDYVRLGFMRGTQLPDPEHLLVGEGKWLRHIKVRTLDAANQPALKALVDAAWTYAKAQLKEKKP
jgi:hypothetical protein